MLVPNRVKLKSGGIRVLPGVASALAGLFRRPLSRNPIQRKRLCFSSGAFRLQDAGSARTPGRFRHRKLDALVHWVKKPTKNGTMVLMHSDKPNPSWHSAELILGVVAHARVNIVACSRKRESPAEVQHTVNMACRDIEAHYRCAIYRGAGGFLGFAGINSGAGFSHGTLGNKPPH